MWMMHILLTYFDLLKSVKHATLVSDNIGAEYIEDGSRWIAVTTKKYISFTILPTNIRQRALKSLGVMSQFGAERRVQWRQAVRAEVFVASVSVQVQRYPVLARFVGGVAHESDRKSIDRRWLSVFGYDTAKNRFGTWISR